MNKPGLRLFDEPSLAAYIILEPSAVMRLLSVADRVIASFQLVRELQACQILAGFL